MGKADVNVNIWLSEKKRFANLFNGVIYGGRQVILPEDLEEVNPVSSVSVKNRTGKTKNMKKADWFPISPPFSCKWRSKKSKR